MIVEDGNLDILWIFANTIRAMAEGRARVFFALGGNFAVATPDSAYTADALAR